MSYHACCAVLLLTDEDCSSCVIFFVDWGLVHGVNALSVLSTVSAVSGVKDECYGRVTYCSTFRPTGFD